MLYHRTPYGWRGDYKHQQEYDACVATVTNPMATPAEVQFARGKLDKLMRLEADQMKQELRRSVTESQ